MTCGGEGKERLVTNYQAVRVMCVLITAYETESHLLILFKKLGSGNQRFSIGIDRKSVV